MRVAIVNHSELIQEAIKLLIATTDGYEVAWLASSGNEAIQKCIADTPDIILMDIDMLPTDGVMATKYIMEHSPCAILIVTSSVQEHSNKTYEALGCGAIDALESPFFRPDGSIEGSQLLLEKLDQVATMLNQSATPSPPAYKKRFSPPPFSRNPVSILAIGSSTGGPQALLRILQKLPADFPAPIVIVQHIDPKFADGLVEWLNKKTSLNIKVAKKGEFLYHGHVYIASTTDHLCLDSNGYLGYTPLPLDVVYRPSIDVFFKSLASYSKNPGVALLLTGMGQDGAEGMLLLRKKGWFTIAQNQQSCVIFGMPKAAIEQGAVRSVLDIDAIPDAIIDRFATPSLTLPSG